MRSLAALPVVLLLLVAVLGFWLDARINRIDALGRHTVGDTPGTVWLLVGSDSRAGLTPEQERELNTGGQLDSARTDTILLVYESPRNGTSLVSIPRDMWVDIPENGRGKINAAYAFGGPNLLVRTVEQNTGVHIDHYAEIGFAGLAGVVDALGTVRVCPPEPLKDPMAGIDLPAGCQELGGKDALGYARSRYASATGDLARVQRQRELIGAISDKAGSAGTLLNPFRSLSLAFSLADTLTIDKRDNLWHLLMLSRSLRDMETVTAPIGGFINVGGQSAIAWGAATRTFFEHMARGDKLPASSPPG